MAISLRSGTTSGDANTVNTITATKVANTALDDIQVIFLGWDNSSDRTLTPAGGWIEVFPKNGTSSIRSAVYWARGDNNNMTWILSGAANTAFGYVLQSWIGVDLSTPIDAEGTASANTGSTSITANAVTIATDQAAHLIGNQSWNAPCTFSASGFSVENNGGSANNPVSVMYKLGLSTGSTGTVSCAGTASASGQILIAEPFALRPLALAMPTPKVFLMQG